MPDRPHPHAHALLWPPFLAKDATLLSMLSGLKRLENGPPAKFAFGQRAQLMALLQWAGAAVPYYRDAPWLAGLRAEMRRAPERFAELWLNLPVLSKAALRTHGPLLNADGVPPAHLPLDKTVTSGSTGIPVEVKTTAVTRLVWDALTVREAQWRQRDFKKRHGAIRYVDKTHRDIRGVLLPSWGPPIAQRYETGAASIIHVGHPLPALVNWMRRFNPHYLLTYPSVAEPLLDALGGKPPALEEISFISEPVPPELETRLAQDWKVRVAEIYSANEVGAIAFRCAEGHLHVQPETILCEILAEDGKPCAVGETGRVVVTALHNLATPLLRYEIGDYATVGEPCICGRPSPVIAKVQGRVRNLVRTPDGRRYWPVSLNAVRSVRAVRQAQYVQTALDTIEMRLVLERPLDEDETAKVIRSVRRALGFAFHVRIVPVEAIPRGPTGKFEEFLSLLPER